MRRKRQQLAHEESVAILQKATAGTLALLGDNGYPYAVPISFARCPAIPTRYEIVKAKYSKRV